MKWLNFILFLLVIGTCQPFTTHACTIFTISIGDKVFFGNNEDWSNPNTYIWFKPTNGNLYGGVYLGFDNFFAQGGMNEKGLCFDANALNEHSLNPHPELPYATKFIVNFILEKCETIDEVITMAKSFNWGTSMPYQVHFADSNGDAVVICPGSDGELFFAKKQEGNNFLISTNFNLNDSIYDSCWRYEKANDMLQNLTNEENLTVNSISGILDATHNEGTYGTKYSNIFDPVNRKIYVYFNHNFTKLIKLDLMDELKKGEHNYTIEELYNSEGYETTSGFSNISVQETSFGFWFLLPFLILSLIRFRKFRNQKL